MLAGEEGEAAAYAGDEGPAALLAEEVWLEEPLASFDEDSVKLGRLKSPPPLPLARVVLGELCVLDVERGVDGCVRDEGEGDDGAAESTTAVGDDNEGWRSRLSPKDIGDFGRGGCKDSLIPPDGPGGARCLADRIDVDAEDDEDDSFLDDIAAADRGLTRPACGR